MVVLVVVLVGGSPTVVAVCGSTTDAGGKADWHTGIRVGSLKRADVGSDGRMVVVGIGGPITGVVGGRVVVGRVGSGGSVVVVVDVVVAIVAAVGGTVGWRVITGLLSCWVAGAPTGAEEAFDCTSAKISVSGIPSAAAIQTKWRTLTADDPRRHIPPRKGTNVKLYVGRCPPPVSPVCHYCTVGW